MPRWNKHPVLNRIIDTNQNHTEEEVKRSLIMLQTQHPSMWWERIYDVKDYIRKCPQCHAPLTRCVHCGHTFDALGCIPPKRKADFHMMYDGMYYRLECKSSQAKDGFLTAYVKTEQIDSLLENERAGGRSLLLISNRYEGPVLHVLRIGEYMTLTNGLQRRFIKWSELGTTGPTLFRLPFHGEPYYDLSTLKAFGGIL